MNPQRCGRIQLGFNLLSSIKSRQKLKGCYGRPEEHPREQLIHIRLI
jgi:hypothetical protein